MQRSAAWLDRALMRLASLIALITLAGWTIRLGRNLRFLRRARRHTVLPDAAPLISVLVPARNESRTIAACIESLARQDYPHYEVIALDDQSTDDTGAQLDAIAAREARVRVIHGTESPPPGWNGKSYAAHRLAQQARGEWLLFTDADTVHAPESVRRGIAQAAALRADLLSAFPQQVTQTWAERLMVSFIVDFLPLVGLDLERIARGRAQRVAANGQYLLVRADCYRAAGGHAAIAAELVDDFALANRLAEQGCIVALVSGVGMLRCRMYSSAHEVWQGFSKNLMLGLSTATGPRAAWQAPAFAFAYAAIFVLPLVGLLRRGHRAVSAITLLWLTLLRAGVGIFLERPAAESLTTLPAAWGVMAIGLNALIRRARGRAVTWKGRDYSPAPRAGSDAA